MANAKEIQNRIRSIQDTMKITRAMYMMSSMKTVFPGAGVSCKGRLPVHGNQSFNAQGTCYNRAYSRYV